MKKIYNKNLDRPFRLSRSKIDFFLNCPRCFYFDRVFGIQQPGGLPFSLNSAVDHLLKKEFDLHRAKNKAHPLMKEYKIDAIPYEHEKLEEWRDSLHRGIRFLHKPTNFLVTGGVDDIWIDNKTKKLLIVDYKATSKDSEVNLDADWQIGYKRQMEVYQWLFRQNGFKVSDIGYFVYCNGRRDNKAFDAKLEFNIKVLPYKGSDSWIEKTLFDIKKTLDSNKIPQPADDCDFCNYREKAGEIEDEEEKTQMVSVKISQEKEPEVRTARVHLIEDETKEKFKNVKVEIIEQKPEPPKIMKVYLEKDNPNDKTK